jgi:transcriptional regulator with XRE-family HTH domain
MSDVTAALGRQIRIYRHNKKLTQEQLAESADLHVSYIIALEKGTRNASIDTLKKLSEAFEISIPELLSFDTFTDSSDEYRIAALLNEYTQKLQLIINTVK